jgi:hemoglobin/transferrin/lactoferrin receptor protein
LYAQDTIPLAEQLQFVVGGRFTWARAEAGRLRDPRSGQAASLDDQWSNASGSGRVLWHPDEAKRTSLYAGASQGFRAPNLSDLTRFDIARSGELETAAPDLQPEKFVSFEAGVKTSQRWWDAGAAYYYTVIDDLIVRVPTGARVNDAVEVTKLNASEGYVHGIEAHGRVHLGDGFSLWGHVAWQKGEADAYPASNAESVRAPMSRVHPIMGMMGLRYETVGGWFGEVFGQAAAKQDDLSPDDRRDTQRIPPGGTPGWATLNARAGYDWKGRVKAVAALENALDEDFRIHGSGFNQPGRNVKLSLEYLF